MSFLKQNINAAPKNLNVVDSKQPAGLPVGFEAVETMVHLTPAPRPTSTQDYSHNAHTEQKEICQRLSDEDSQLFSPRDTILKVVSNERQYKQRQQFSSKSSVESLCDLLEKNSLVLKCNFVRPGFSASNTCLMCTPEQLREGLKSEGDDFNLKKVRLNLESDSSFSPENGTMYLSMIQNLKTGNHMLYSLDYHVAERHDKNLFCEE